MARFVSFVVKLNMYKKIARILILITILNPLLGLFSPQKAQAANFSEAAILLYRMGAGVANSSTNPILVLVKPATVGTEADVQITWPTSNGFTVNGTAGNHTVTTTGLPSTFQGETITAWPGIGSAATNVSGGTVTIASSDLSVGTLYGFLYTGGITNPVTGDAGTHLVTITTRTSGPATIDSTEVAVDVVTTNSDQVTVTATVPATFNFNVQDPTLALGTLSTGSVSNNAMSSPIDIDVNANNGWVAFIRSEGVAASLASASSGDSISSTNTGSPVTLSSGTEGYVVDVSGSQGGNSTGSLTIATEYDGNGTTSGGVISTSYEQIAQSTGQAENDNLTLTVIAAISAVTEAASDYTDTWEIVGAGNF